MSDVRYAPPKASVQDIPTPPLKSAPRSVLIGRYLLWIRLGLELGTAVVVLTRMTGPLMFANLLYSSVVLSFESFMTVSVCRGRAWARIAFAGWTTLAVFSAFARSRDYVIVLAVINDILFALDFVILYLLFTKSAGTWFRELATRQ